MFHLPEIDEDFLEYRAKLRAEHLEILDDARALNSALCVSNDRVATVNDWFAGRLLRQMPDDAPEN